MEKKTEAGNVKRQYQKPQLQIVTLQSEKSMLQGSPTATTATITTTMSSESYLEVITW